jgi:hypothetical protein
MMVLKKSNTNLEEVETSHDIVDIFDKRGNAVGFDVKKNKEEK